MLYFKFFTAAAILAIAMVTSTVAQAESGSSEILTDFMQSLNKATKNEYQKAFNSKLIVSDVDGDAESIKSELSGKTVDRLTATFEPKAKDVLDSIIAEDVKLKEGMKIMENQWKSHLQQKLQALEEANPEVFAKISPRHAIQKRQIEYFAKGYLIGFFAVLAGVAFGVVAYHLTGAIVTAISASRGNRRAALQIEMGYVPIDDPGRVPLVGSDFVRGDVTNGQIVPDAGEDLRNNGDAQYPKINYANQEHPPFKPADGADPNPKINPPDQEYPGFKAVAGAEPPAPNTKGVSTIWEKVAMAFGKVAS